MPQQDYIPLIITGTVHETATVKSFTLTTQNGETLPYRAGQFLSFGVYSGLQEDRRSYSFASSPGIDKEMQIAVKRIDNGLFSRKLHDQYKTGDVLYCTGVSGFFTLPENIAAYTTLFFFAAGVGITPVFSIIKTALHDYPHIHIVLFYSNRSEKDTVFYKELELLRLMYAERLRITYLFSSSRDLSIARLHKELLPELVKRYATSFETGNLYYVCGPHPYMRMVIYALEEMQIPANNIKKEHFNTTITAYKPQPPDKTPHTVRLHFADKNYSFVSGYPDTLLQSAERNGIALPYSCRNGVCGSCAALCTEGKVWHSANEVLTDKDLEAGMVLTCVGYPVAGDISLKM